MKTFQRPEHQTIARALRLMDPDFLLKTGCWFAGGTAIVMMLGEYRRSLDVDFLCSDVDGYRMLRSVAVEKGMAGLFAAPAEALREVRVDQYGVRTMISLDGQTIRFEVVRESRIALHGDMDADMGVPTLSPPDMMAEKLLANADRCQDRSVAYRDAIDLGMLIDHFGPIPPGTIAKTETAYGMDIARKAAWVSHRLTDPMELEYAAEALLMNIEDTELAVKALTAETHRLWPAAFDRRPD